MPALIEELRRLHRECSPSCYTLQCRRGRCRLGIPQDGSTAAIDCDYCSAFDRSDSRPDFLVMKCSGEHRATWVVVEMKSRPSRSRHIVEQLEAGLCALCSDRRFAVVTSASKSFALVLHSRRIHHDDHRILTRTRMSCCGRPVPVLVRRCGVSLGSLV